MVQAVKRNADRFPDDFMFQLDTEEWDALRSQSVTSNTGRGGRRYAPYAFTEQGVAMLSSVLGSAQAIAVNIEIMRAFVRLREMIVSNKELALRLDELENKSELMALQHDTFARNTRAQLKQVFEAIRELMMPPETPPKRPIGFIMPEEKPAKPIAAKIKNSKSSLDGAMRNPGAPARAHRRRQSPAQDAPDCVFAMRPVSGNRRGANTGFSPTCSVLLSCIGPSPTITYHLSVCAGALPYYSVEMVFLRAGSGSERRAGELHLDQGLPRLRRQDASPGNEVLGEQAITKGETITGDFAVCRLKHWRVDFADGDASIN
ncbi:MAG: ORF6N domain-containing protein [Sulfuricella sp.]